MPETLAGREKKSGPVAPALDYASSDPSMRQRGAVKRTRVFQGIERSVSIEQSDRKTLDMNEFRCSSCQLVDLSDVDKHFHSSRPESIYLLFRSCPPDIHRAYDHIGMPAA